MNWSQFMQNPKSMALKAFMQQALQNGYPAYEDVMSRIAVVLVTDNDLALFAKMINEIYESGYAKAVSDYKDQLNKMGIQVTTKNRAENQK